MFVVCQGCKEELEEKDLVFNMEKGLHICPDCDTEVFKILLI